MSNIILNKSITKTVTDLELPCFELIVFPTVLDPLNFKPIKVKEPKIHFEKRLKMFNLRIKSLSDEKIELMFYTDTDSVVHYVDRTLTSLRFYVGPSFSDTISIAWEISWRTYMIYSIKPQNKEVLTEMEI